jgi:phenylalanyl-tRNA synthetase beta chain
MKIPYSWLQSQFNNQLPPIEKLADLFTFRAFEVEGIEGDEIDLKVLPDRAHYALSWNGIAYEVSAMTGLPWTQKVYEEKKGNGKKVDIKIDHPKCNRYVGRYIGNIKTKNVVEITNDVMFVTGQPTHAFDADKIVGGITVRPAKEDEHILTLDGKDITLKPTIMVIADDQGPLAIAGVKGGDRAKVTDATKNILLESAHFDAVHVRRASTQVGIKNDSSKRFENDISPSIAIEAMHMLSSLIDGEYGDIVDIYPHPVAEWSVTIDPKVISDRLGVEIPEEKIKEILSLLKIKNEDWKLTPPLYRLDLKIPEDFVEEVGRLYGYENIPAKLPIKTAALPVHPQFYYIETLKDSLIEKGYSETILYTLGKKGHYETAYPVAKDRAFLRDTLMHHLETSIIQNTRNADLLEMEMIRQFEIGKVFDADGEHFHLGLAIGFAKKIKGNTPADELKKTFAELGFTVPEIKIKDLTAWGEVRFTIPDEVTGIYNFQKSSNVKYVPISPYPFAVRDVALFVPDTVTEQEVRKIIETNAGNYCVRLRLFDLFKKEGKTSMAFRMVFQASDKTLTEEEINTPLQAVYDALKSKGWEIR